MTLLFGQFPQQAFVAGQFVLHALVGSVGDPIPPQPPQPPSGIHTPVGDAYRRAYLRRSEISPSQEVDEDVIIATAILFTLENTLP